MDALRKKSLKMTDYFYSLLDELDQNLFTILTPRQHKNRGAQFSIVVHEKGRKIFEELEKNGVICDWREPDCIRVAPVPLYNSFEDIYKFVQIFSAAIHAQNKMKEAV
jgi:kynureninase